MSDTTSTERLTRDNTAVLLIDHQVGLYSGVVDIPLAELKHNVVALTKAAQVLGLPIVATTTATESMWGPMIPELAAALPADLAVPDRTTVNAWDDPRVADAVRATGRTKLLIAGISTEVCLAFAALSTTAEGFDAYAVIDAAGTFSQAKREAGLLRIQQAGVTPDRLRHRDRRDPLRQRRPTGRRGLRSPRHAIRRTGRPDRPSPDQELRAPPESADPGRGRPGTPSDGPADDPQLPEAFHHDRHHRKEQDEHHSASERTAQYPSR
jgi:nicotinamidase-related amidase